MKHLLTSLISFSLICCTASMAVPPIEPAVRDSLLSHAKRWKVPQPDKDSTLWKSWQFGSNSKPSYALGFKEPGKPKQILIGFDRHEIRKGEEILPVPDPENLSLSDITPTSPFGSAHGVNFGLITGIQLIRQGEEKIGTALIQKSLGEEAGHHRSSFKSPANEDPILMLARTCLADAMNQVTTTDPDFRQIKERIELLVTDQPKLKSKATDWALEALQASADHPPAEADSIEALIDAYLLGGGTDGALAHSKEMSPSERVLILKGFEAVPVLLAQRDSKRFTNHLMQGFNNFVSYPMNAGQVIDAYLRRLANDEFGSNWLDKQKGYTAEKDTVLAWWDQASKTGEEEYVKKNTIRPAKDNGARESEELLLIARDRYPEQLPGFYRTLIKTKQSSGSVAGAISESNALTTAAKLKLLREGFATNHQQHRNAALRRIRDLDATLSDKLLTELLQNAPSTAKIDFWRDQDAALGQLVAKSTSEDVWKALHSLLKRADLGMRMELIEHLSPPEDAPAAILESYHSIFERYRNDKTVRDESSDPKFSGPGAGFPHDRISMRNFIHMHWADWLNLDLEEPPENSSAIAWAAYRKKVTKAVELNWSPLTE